MKKYELQIPGNPTACMRPRVTRTHAYDPQAKLKVAMRDEIIKQVNGDPELPIKKRKGQWQEIDISMLFVFQLPKSRKLVDGKFPTHNIKPDLDNCIKLIGDVMNGIIYEDDAQIDSITASKMYGPKPFTLIEITSYDR